MNSLKIIFITVIISSSCLISKAQDFEGIWKGTSICQVKNSPCHDEVVVYYISKDSTGKYPIVANKVIDGKEEYMGTITCIEGKTGITFFSEDKERNARWEFTIDSNKMHGTLMYQGKLYRIIEVQKVIK